MEGVCVYMSVCPSHLMGVLPRTWECSVEWEIYGGYLSVVRYYRQLCTRCRVLREQDPDESLHRPTACWVTLAFPSLATLLNVLYVCHFVSLTSNI